MPEGSRDLHGGCERGWRQGRQLQTSRLWYNLMPTSMMARLHSSEWRVADKTLDWEDTIWQWWWAIAGKDIHNRLTSKAGSKQQGNRQRRTMQRMRLLRVNASQHWLTLQEHKEELLQWREVTLLVRQRHPFLSDTLSSATTMTAILGLSKRISLMMRHNFTQDAVGNYLFIDLKIKNFATIAQ